MAPYPFDDTLKKWLSLTNYITAATVERYGFSCLGDNANPKQTIVTIVR